MAVDQGCPWDEKDRRCFLEGKTVNISSIFLAEHKYCFLLYSYVSTDTSLISAPEIEKSR